jgi:HEAT repeat protein
MKIRALLSPLLALAVLGAALAPARAADRAKEQALLATLRSDAAPAEKAMACRQLAIHGTAEAVPVLAPLLSDPALASWARIALQAIPDPAADAALREAAGRLQGRLLVGVLNTIGMRRDAQAVSVLTGHLQATDVEVASAAAVALGRIGTEPAAQALQARLANAPAALGAALGEGCVRAADHLRATGKTAAALALYDAARAAQLPPQQRLEATRGAILARGTEGLPLLLEQLRAEDKGAFALGLRVARELPGADVTQGLIRALDSLPAARQPLLLLALADRHDPAVRPAVMQAARAGAPALRLAAVQVLAEVGDAASVPVLLEAAVAPDRDLARAARQSLQRLHAEGVDAALTERLAQATGAERAVLMELCGQRRIRAALPALLGAVQDPQPEIRRAALQAVGALGGETELAELARLVSREADPARRNELEGALLDVGGRVGARGVPQLLPLVRHAEPAVRVIGLHALAGVGGAEALAAVVAATRDAAETVQDEAVRALSTWPNNWPDDVAVAEPLLALVKSGAKRAHQVLGLRGYLQYLQADKHLADPERVERIRALLPQLPWPEEKQAAISALATLRTAGALDLLQSLAAEAAVAEEAHSALVTLASREIPEVSKEKRRAVLQEVAAKTRNDATRKRAEEALRRIQ